MNILIQVGDSVSVVAVDENGQYSGAGLLNQPGQTLRGVIQRYWGHPNLVLVEDLLFGTGYHGVVTGCSAGGHGWTYRLYQVFSMKENIAAHNRMVHARKNNLPMTKPGVILAFERLKELESQPIPTWEEYDAPMHTSEEAVLRIENMLAARRLRREHGKTD